LQSGRRDFGGQTAVAGASEGTKAAPSAWVLGGLLGGGGGGGSKRTCEEGARKEEQREDPPWVLEGAVRERTSLESQKANQL